MELQQSVGPCNHRRDLVGVSEPAVVDCDGRRLFLNDGPSEVPDSMRHRRLLFFSLAAALCLSAGVFLYAATSPRSALREPPPTAPLLPVFEQPKDGPRPTALPPATHAIPVQPSSQLAAGTPETRTQEPSPTRPRSEAFDHPAPGTRSQEPSPTGPQAYALDSPPPGTVESPPEPAYSYDAIAATEDERRAADEVSKQFHADEEKILAQMRSGKLDRKDVKPALLRRIQMETESLNGILGT